MISPNGEHPQSIPGSRVQVVFGPGNLARIGEIAKSQGGSRVLLVTDPGIRDAGHVERAVRALYKAGLPVRVFDEVGENPTTIHVGKGVIAPSVSRIGRTRRLRLFIPTAFCVLLISSRVRITCITLSCPRD